MYVSYYELTITSPYLMYAVVDAGVYYNGVGALVCQFDGGVGGRGGRGRRGRCLDDAGRARH